MFKYTKITTFCTNVVNPILSVTHFFIRFCQFCKPQAALAHYLYTMATNTKIHNCRSYSAQEIIEFMIRLNPLLRIEDNRNKVYVGATGDIRERMRRHNTKELLFAAQTAGQRVAAKVEATALKYGFHIGNVKHGGNGTNSHSIYIYAYRITKETIE